MNPSLHQAFSWRLFFCLTLALAGFAIFQGHDFVFGPARLETGDFAANALQILDARNFRDIYGNYSRWGFNHPGPFFFYCYSLGERLFFDVLHLVNSPHQAHVLTGILVQSLLIALTIALVTGATRRPLSAPILALAASVVLLHAGSAISSIWPPHVLLGPTILLIVTCALLAIGRSWAMPLATAMTCILCHGHVAQPLMTAPLLVVAILLYARARMADGISLRECIREATYPSLTSLAIILIFLVPLMVDLFRCPDCNLMRIVGYMQHAGEATPSWRKALNSVASYFVFDHAPEHISDMRHVSLYSPRIVITLTLVAASLVIPRFVRRQLPADPAVPVVRSIATFASLALLLTCLWAKRITGPLYEFNSYFTYGLVFILVGNLLVAISLLWRQPGERATWVGWAAVVFVTAFMPRLPVFSEPYVLLDPTPIRDRHPSGNLLVLNQVRGEDWPTMAALAAWLNRSGDDFVVPRGWSHVFGWTHGFDAKRVLALGNRIEVWEPGRTFDMNVSRTFDPALACHITASTSAPGLEGPPQPLEGARRACTVAAYGLGALSDDPWSWTVEDMAVLQFRSRTAAGPVELAVHATPLLAPGRLDRQRVDVRINGQAVGQMSFTRDETATLEIPAAVWNLSPVTTLELVLPDATSPAALGLSPDPRMLAIGVHGIGINYR